MRSYTGLHIIGLLVQGAVGVCGVVEQAVPIVRLSKLVPSTVMHDAVHAALEPVASLPTSPPSHAPWLHVEECHERWPLLREVYRELSAHPDLRAIRVAVRLLPVVSMVQTMA